MLAARFTLAPEIVVTAATLANEYRDLLLNEEGREIGAAANAAASAEADVVREGAGG